GSELTMRVDDLNSNCKKVSVLNITNFIFFFKQKTAYEIRTVLSKIPNTIDLSKSTGTPTVIPTTSIQQGPVATATVTGKGTPTATATNQPKTTPTATVGKGTPTPAASPTASATPTTNLPTIPVHVVDVQPGTTTQTIIL